MKITRTANCGVLIELDAKRILVDGVTKPLYPYLGTPQDIREDLETNFPDIVMYTHKHEDHFDESYAEKYVNSTLRHYIVSEMSCAMEESGIKLSFIKTRHIGKTDVAHTSILISGSMNILLTGDASPLEFRKIDLPKIDVLVAPFAYATTKSSFTISKGIAKEIVILHLPKPNEDELGLNKMVRDTIENDSNVHILEMGETFIFDN